MKNGKMTAFVQIVTEPNTEDKIHKMLESMEEVSEVYQLFGEWDIIARVEVDSVEELNSFVTDKIRAMKEVKLTSTMIVAK